MPDGDKCAALPWRFDAAVKKRYVENLAPVALFTYNRPEHTKKTVEALKQNVLAEDTELYIYSDGPKDDAAKEKVEDVRKYLRSLSGFKNIHLTEREENVGLAENIIFGITTLTEKYGKVIVIEDDIVTTKYFLQYMNDALEIYKDEERVMTVSGFCETNDKEGLPETYFLPWPSCWGWATWKRSWDFFERDPQKALRETSAEVRFRLNRDGTWDIWEQVVNNVKGNICTWAVFFDLAVIKQKGLSLYPQYDLCKNIGADGSGEHGLSTIYNRGNLPDVEISNFTLDIQENEIGVERLKSFNKNVKKTLRRNSLSLLWLDEDSVGFWQSERGNKIIYALDKNTSWLVMGDGRNALTSMWLKVRGFKKATAADTFPDRLEIASDAGYIDDFLVLSPDKLELPPNSYDYVFCRDIFRVTHRPYFFIRELLRVVKRGIVLTAPIDIKMNDMEVNYKSDENVVPRLSASKLIKIAASLKMSAVYFYVYNDVYLEGALYEPADEEKSEAYREIKAEIAKLDESVKNGEAEYNMGSAALFKEPLGAEEIENLKKIGGCYLELKRNP